MKTRSFVARLSALAYVTFGVCTVNAEDKAPPLPWLVSGAHMYQVGVAWNDEALKLLPAGLKATAERTGGINIYQAPKGYGLSPYQAGYVWIDVEGHDSADGAKGRYIMQGGVGPEKSQAALRALFQSDIVPGGTQLEDGGVKRATGIRNGQSWAQIEIKSSGECQPVAGTFNYPISGSEMIQIPYTGEACKAEPGSAKLTLPQGEKGAALQPAKLLWAAELRDTNFAFTKPVAMK
jgi:hypothetical protein